MRPMLATPAPQRGVLPVGAAWAYEVKWDGMRVLADVTDGRVRLTTRTGRDVTVGFPELQSLAALPDALLDGEVVAMNAAGIPDFTVLMERIHVTDRTRAAGLAERVPASFIVFDVLRLYGVDLTGRSFDERRTTLDRVDVPRPVQVSPLYDDGAALLQATREQGLEGVVAKRRSSTYQPGRRSPDWVKTAHRLSRTCLVGGWRPEVDSTTRIGAVLVGAPDEGGGLVYVGRVGSGIGGAARKELTEALLPLTVASSPFENAVPAVDALGATWCRPELAVEVQHLGWTTGRRLRQPAFRGIRLDAEADPVPATGPGVSEGAP